MPQIYFVSPLFIDYYLKNYYYLMKNQRKMETNLYIFLYSTQI